MRGTWQTTHSGGPVVLAVVAVVVALVAAEWMLARIWWILGGTVVIVALAVAVVLLLVRWSDRRAVAVFAARPVYQIPPSSPPRLETPDRPAIAPAREVHLHLNVTPDQLAAIVRHHLEEDR